MNIFNVGWRNLRNLLASASNILALVALIVVFVGSVVADNLITGAHQKSIRFEVQNQVVHLKARLEANLASNFRLLKILGSVFEADPDLTQEQFAQLVSRLFLDQQQLKSVSAAPDLVVSLTYPLKGNESVIGLDYHKNDAQRAAAYRARDTNSLIVAGPLNLVQGGTGFVGRLPVFTKSASGEQSFWGIVAAVVDTEKLFETSGIFDAGFVKIAMTGKDASGRDGALFFGSESVLENSPITVDVKLPYGTWGLYAIPSNGWTATPGYIWAIRIVEAIVGVFIVVPMLLAGWLSSERQRNLVELREREERLQQLSHRLELALTSSEIGVWEFNPTTSKAYWDRQLRNLFGVEHDNDISAEEWFKVLHPDDATRVREEFRSAFINQTAFNSDFRIKTLNTGEERVIRSTGVLQRNADGHGGMVGVNWDISKDVRLNEQLRDARKQSEARNIELEKAKARIEHNALHDSLTGLPNRRYLDELLAGRSDIEIPAGENIGLLHIDLDRFKQINDAFGHAAGDAMLIHASTVLRDNVRMSDFVARIGGDEFVVVCTSAASNTYLEEIASRIVTHMREPMTHNGRVCRAGVSIGIACTFDQNEDRQQLLVNADIALYRAKNLGRNGYQFFTTDMHLAAVNTKRLGDEILAGIEQKQFTAQYQGQFDAHTLELNGVEALARWEHPTKGTLMPGVFMEVAEELNVMAQIDSIILNDALMQMKRWKRSGINVPKVAVNVSARRLGDKDLIAGLKQLDIEPGKLTFELLESTFLDNRDDLVAWNIDQIREMGIDIEIDDFGTGHASLISLMQLRPHRLKIDRQLVQPTDESHTQRNLVRSIVQIGETLGIGTVAEGVETVEHIQILRDLGCQTLQGYALARPMTGRALTRYVRNETWREKLTG